MAKRSTYVLALVLSFLPLVSCSRGRVIPEDDLSDIYVEMFLADQWLQNNLKYRTQADTTSFYESIFRKYGYRTRDYRVSMEHYIKDPKHFGEIVKKTTAKLEKESKRLEALAAAIDAQSFLRHGHNGYETRVFDTLNLWPAAADSSIVAVAIQPQDTSAVQQAVEENEEVDVRIFNRIGTNAERRDSIRPHKLTSPRKLARIKPVTGEGEDLQF